MRNKKKKKEKKNQRENRNNPQYFHVTTNIGSKINMNGTTNNL